MVAENQLTAPTSSAGRPSRLAVVTGAAGFIGSHLCERLLADGWTVLAVDRFSDYYPTAIKQQNLEACRSNAAFRLVEADLAAPGLGKALGEVAGNVDVVFHLAAQPGVRSSWGQGFDVYSNDNIIATQRLLEWCLAAEVRRLVLASSSSVYGLTTDLPMRETSLPRPFSPYGVTKLAAEHLCGLYAANFGLRTVALRYFTVYGPRQRPDMGLHRFFAAWIGRIPVKVYGDGSQTRDFTFVADVVDATVAAAVLGEPGSVYNVAGGHTRTLTDVLEAIGRVVGGDVSREYVSTHEGDVPATSADISRAAKDLRFAPQTDFEQGLRAQYQEILRRLDLYGLPVPPDTGDRL